MQRKRGWIGDRHVVAIHQEAVDGHLVAQTSSTHACCCVILNVVIAQAGLTLAAATEGITRLEKIVGALSTVLLQHVVVILNRAQIISTRSGRTITVFPIAAQQEGWRDLEQEVVNVHLVSERRGEIFRILAPLVPP